MQTNEWTNILVNYFTLINDYELQCESLRKELVNDSNFNSNILFTYIDNNNKSFLSLNDFKLLISKYPINYEEECLRRMIHHYDKDEDFAINYNEFTKLIFPDNYQETESNNKEKPEYLIPLLIKLIQVELKMNKELAIIADKLKNSKFFTTYEAFIAITGKEKYITEKNLKQFLFNNNISVDNIDFNKLMYRLDCDIDGQISYNEFIQIFFPYRTNF